MRKLADILTSLELVIGFSFVLKYFELDCAHTVISRSAIAAVSEHKAHGYYGGFGELGYTSGKDGRNKKTHYGRNRMTVR